VVNPFKIVDFHEASNEALKCFIDEIEKQNLILKEKAKELEKYLIPIHLFVKPIIVIQPLCSIEKIYWRQHT
jgi:hypothetical protein